MVFLTKYREKRKTRGIRATDEEWERLRVASKKEGKTIAHYLICAGLEKTESNTDQE